MMKSFDEFQTFGKTGMEAYVASSSALTKGFQAMAQEAADFSRKSFEKSTAAFEKLSAVKSLDKVLETQQALAKDSYETMVAQMTKFNELYVFLGSGERLERPESGGKLHKRRGGKRRGVVTIWHGGLLRMVAGQ